ncbi:MAG: exodeoxyribonuclease VII small subunit [Ignavibacteria bacterium]
MKNMTYAKAEEELNLILQEIETESVDIDDLTIKIKRACELLQYCNAKLKSTDEEVKKILKDFESKNLIQKESDEEKI